MVMYDWVHSHTWYTVHKMNADKTTLDQTITHQQL